MQQILTAAQKTDTNSIVLIPIGAGVFLPRGPERLVAMQQIREGWVEALKAYQGPEMTVYCCLFNGLDAIMHETTNPQIKFINCAGQDAYTVANFLEDSGQKSMLVNAGNHDWIASLQPHMGPGQLVDGCYLFTQTSDEYFALMTKFKSHSLQALNRHYQDDLIGCITSSTFIPSVMPRGEQKTNTNTASAEYVAEPVNPLHPASASRLTMEQKQLVQEFITFLKDNNDINTIRRKATREHITKEMLVKHIKDLSRSEQVPLIKQIFAHDGGGLHAFFANSRGFRSTAEHRGTFKQLAEILDPTLKGLSFFSRSAARYRTAVESASAPDLDTNPKI